MKAVRIVIALAALLAAIVCVARAWDALSPLFPGGYVDSPVFVYLLFGVPWVLAALALVWVASKLLRPARIHRASCGG